MELLHKVHVYRVSSIICFCNSANLFKMLEKSYCFPILEFLRMYIINTNCCFVAYRMKIKKCIVEKKNIILARFRIYHFYPTLLLKRFHTNLLIFPPLLSRIVKGLFLDNLHLSIIETIMIFVWNIIIVIFRSTSVQLNTTRRVRERPWVRLRPIDLVADQFFHCHVNLHFNYHSCHERI